MRAVIDTNVLFEGLTYVGPSAAVIDAWAARLFQPCVSTALALEYQDVLARKLRPERADIALRAPQALLVRCEYVPILLQLSARESGCERRLRCGMRPQRPSFVGHTQRARLQEPGG